MFERIYVPDWLFLKLFQACLRLSGGAKISRTKPTKPDKKPDELCWLDLRRPITTAPCLPRSSTKTPTKKWWQRLKTKRGKKWTHPFQSLLHRVSPFLFPPKRTRSRRRPRTNTPKRHPRTLPPPPPPPPPPPSFHPPQRHCHWPMPQHPPQPLLQQTRPSFLPMPDPNSLLKHFRFLLP